MENKSLVISKFIPIFLPTQPSMHSHWRVRAGHVRTVRLLVESYFLGIPLPIPCIIHLRRISPRLCDDDNLQGSLKVVRDAIAEIMIPGLAPGRADGDPRITWKYSQGKGKPHQKGVTIEITAQPQFEI